MRLERRRGGDDVRAPHGVGGVGGLRHRDAGAVQVAPELGDRPRVGVVDPQARDAERRAERQRLELRLRAQADQGHGARARPGEMAGGEHRGGGGAQRGRERHLAQEHWVAGGDVGQRAQPGDSQQARRGVGRVAVDVLEGVQHAVRNRHQLDHPGRRVAGQARGFLECLPAAEILLQVRHQAEQERVDPDPADQAGDVRNTDMLDHRRRTPRPAAPPRDRAMHRSCRQHGMSATTYGGGRGFRMPSASRSLVLTPATVVRERREQARLRLCLKLRQRLAFGNLDLGDGFPEVPSLRKEASGVSGQGPALACWSVSAGGAWRQPEAVSSSLA